MHASSRTHWAVPKEPCIFWGAQCALDVIRVIAVEVARGIFLKQKHICVIVEECVLTLIVTVLIFNR